MAKRNIPMGEDAEMDMTPMIDIVFNLLIFFLIVSDLNQKDLAELTLPIAYMATEDKDNDPDERLILNVDNRGQILYKGRVRTLDELGTILDQARRLYDARTGGKGMEDVGNGAKASKLFVLLRADKDTPWQHVQWLMTIMAEQKLYKCQFATKKFLDGDYPARPRPNEDIGMTGLQEGRMLGGITQDEGKEHPSLQGGN